MPGFKIIPYLLLFLCPFTEISGYFFIRNSGIIKPRIPRSTSDQSVNGYLTERTCWWNEICKEEFQSLFRCKCPDWSFCRAPGRYYNAVCTMTATGYIWLQPDLQPL